MSEAARPMLNQNADVQAMRQQMLAFQNAIFVEFLQSAVVFEDEYLGEVRPLNGRIKAPTRFTATWEFNHTPHILEAMK